MQTSIMKLCYLVSLVLKFKLWWWEGLLTGLPFQCTDYVYTNGGPVWVHV